MNRQEFFTILIRELRNIQPNELQDVLQYYNEYFDDAGIENEQAVLDDLGSPQKIAEAIRETSTMRYIETGKKTPGKSLKVLWVTLVSIFAVPIGIPVAAALFIVLLAVLIVYGAVILSFFIIAFSFALTGVLLSIFSFFLLPMSFPVFLFMLGTGLTLAGLGILGYIPTVMLTRVSFKGIILLINKITRRGKND